MSQCLRRHSLACATALFFSFTLSAHAAAFQGFADSTAFTLADSSRKALVNLHAQLLDSAAITNLLGTPTHYDNSASVRIFLDGKFTDAFNFAARVKVSTDHTNRDIADHFYNPNEGIPYNKQSDNKRTWDLFAAKARYDIAPFGLLAGFDYLESGPARRHHVIMRGEHSFYRPWQDSSSRIFDPAPTPYFGYEFTLGPLTYTQHAAKLFEKKGAGKYFHHHRLAMNLPFDITLGLSETSLYGTTTEAPGTNPNADAEYATREMEWAYVIPFVPYVFGEHLLGDQDNISLAFDLSVKTLRNWELYAELLWDDMKSPTSMFDDSWWGNKWAATIGIARDNLKLGPVTLDWFAEYTRIEPWVYTHHKGGGYTYANYAQSLGSDLGPNAQEIHNELSATWKFVKGTIFAGAIAKDTAFGGNIGDIHGPEDPFDKKFLNDETTIRYGELGGALAITPWYWASLKASYTRFFGDYEGYRATLGLSTQF
ncbi:hypothetical protein [uncultured Fibrobacter sp.]|uniref:hypothetical protein n=1 Tax=uncultured Fibrobacter sp. TaxID=261512 RepID=UPI0025D42BAD|nr:hypothetical protein [uncultured Fibrobacter sp.]